MPSKKLRKFLQNLSNDLFSVVLGIKLEYPILSWKLNRFWVLLNFSPVSFMPHITRRFSGLLNGADAVVAASNVKRNTITQKPDL